MKKLAWLTDIHLNFLNYTRLSLFCTEVSKESPDAVLIGGDIAEAPSLERYLRFVKNRIDVPIYFVLGNHDFYHGSISVVRSEMKNLSKKVKGLQWLGLEDIVEMAPNVALIGYDGWSDGKLGNYAQSSVVLNDYLLIRDLAGLNKHDRLLKLNGLGDEAAAHAKKVLLAACNQYQKVICLTHVPPFKEACWHEGKISDDNWLPHFTNKAAGDVLKEVMIKYPRCSLTVLCGHTHGEGYAKILPNLEVKTGGATYGSPRVQEIIIIP